MKTADSSVVQCAQAFVNGTSHHAPNAHTDGTTYTLHRTVIARKARVNTDTADIDGVALTFGGYYTPTTKNHLLRIADAISEDARAAVNHEWKHRTGHAFFALLPRPEPAPLRPVHVRIDNPTSVCEDCGDEVGTLILSVTGAQVCRPCFNKGTHG